MSPRDVARHLADRYGYFWLPCPRCGEYFGGYEPHDAEGVRCQRDPTTLHIACCSRVSDVADVAACRRVHEERDELCTSCGLEVVRVEPPAGVSFAVETMFVLTHPPTHGGATRCPGPPQPEFVPWWRSLLELLGIV